MERSRCAGSASALRSDPNDCRESKRGVALSSPEGWGDVRFAAMRRIDDDALEDVRLEHGLRQALERRLDEVVVLGVVGTYRGAVFPLLERVDEAERVALALARRRGTVVSQRHLAARLFRHAVSDTQAS